VDAVVFDLFGTLVPAPTPQERSHAASRLATVVGCSTAKVERYFCDTWHVRHDGTLPTMFDLVAHLVHAVHRRDVPPELVANELLTLGQNRLMPDLSVVHVLESLRSKGMLLGILSDSSAEVVAAWSTSPLCELVDSAVFSCEAGTVKPDQRLYDRIRKELNVPVQQMLYVGDGGGDELHGALTAGMAAVAVHRRGPADAFAFGDANWSGPILDAVEQVPAYLARQT
jgi:putative hydrolase of the HAD superfamily